jgi:RNA polymerase sigma-70 factor (ECF subfamily)
MMPEPSNSADYANFIRRVRQGDEAAAEELVRRYESEIRLEIRTSLRMRDPRLRRVFDSMDICQSVLASFFVQATIGEFELDEPGQLIRLLVGMARNKLAAQVRHHQRRRRDVRRLGTTGPEEHGAASLEETPSQLISSREMIQEFRARLTEEERNLADLRARGSDWATIAQELGGTAEGRRKQVARAIARIEQELGLGKPVD